MENGKWKIKGRPFFNGKLKMENGKLKVALFSIFNSIRGYGGTGRRAGFR